MGLSVRDAREKLFCFNNLATESILTVRKGETQIKTKRRNDDRKD